VGPPGHRDDAGRRGRILLAVAWTVAVLVACWTPKSRLPVPEQGAASFRIPHLDKAVHLGMFSVFGVLWMRAGGSRGWAPYVLAGGLALAVASELGQGLPIVGRDPDAVDTLADAAGVALGTWAARRRGGA
jgi:hypothetical protein